MVNKLINISYNQIPHIVQNHPDTNPEHWSIMICLFRILKDKEKCAYSNEQLALDSRISIRTLERRLPELKSMGFIVITGKSYARRFKLGILFNTSATMAELKLNTSAKNAETSAKSDINLRHGGGHTNITTKNNNKETYPQTKGAKSIKELLENLR